MESRFFSWSNCVDDSREKKERIDGFARLNYLGSTTYGVGE